MTAAKVPAGSKTLRQSGELVSKVKNFAARIGLRMRRDGTGRDEPGVGDVVERASHNYIGVDLGQKLDFTAIAVVEHREGGPPHWLDPWRVPRDTYRLRYLERVALGTPYSKIVEKLAALVEKPELQGRCTMIVDGTGVGWPVVEMLKQQPRVNCPVVAVTITGGERAHRHKDGWNLPKQDLPATLLMMLEDGELEIAAKLGERRRLVEELMGMQAGRTRTGRARYGARGAAHDDLVLAVALACWRARQPKAGLQGTGRLV